MSDRFPWMEEKKFFDLLRRVQKPARYIGGEWNCCSKDPSTVKTKVALVFPDVYEIGMSYLGQKILYDRLNAQPDILADRVFAPWPDMEKELRQRDWPLFSLENRFPLKVFDFIGVSLLYELSYINVLTILDLGRIPLRAEKRGEEDPLVIGGGPGALNPEPLAPFFDLFLLGDGEEAFLEIIRNYQQLKSTGANRLSILKKLARMGGIYVPRFYEADSTSNLPLLVVRPKEDVPAYIHKRILKSLDRAEFPVSIVVPNIQIIHDRVAMEIARGCPQKCRFCQAQAIYFPFRVRQPDKVIDSILTSLDSTGYEDCSLTALSISDYPYLNEVIKALMGELEERKISLSLSSLRPTGLTQEAIKNILKVRKTGFTLVPEAGTQRLRQVINKNLKDEEIVRAAELAFTHGWRLLKLYFMIGLPTEKMEDIEALIALTEDIYNLGRKILHRPPQINLSLSPFIPKPHTPFQWLAMANPGELEQKMSFIKSRLKRFSTIKIKDRPIEMAIIEAVLSRGDRRLATIIEKIWRKGARFDSWGDNFNFSLWQQAFQEIGLSMEDYLGSLDLQAELPWDRFLTGLKKEFLKQELERAWRAEPTPSCFDHRCLSCLGCESPGEFKPRKPEISLLISSLKKKKTTKIKRLNSVNRYLIFYKKSGLARFLSHLDTIRAIGRALRRGKIQVAFSQGFHPKIVLAFPPPLALGMEGYGECFELKSRQLLAREEIINQLNEFLPAGLKFTSIRPVPTLAPSLTKRLKAAIYFLPLDQPEIIESNNKIKAALEGEKNLLVWLEEKVGEYTSHLRPEEKIWLDLPRSRLYFQLPFAAPSFRPRDFIERTLGLTGLSFYLVREKIMFNEDEST